MNSDYVSRQALLDIFEDTMEDDNVMCPVIKVLTVSKAIENQPAANVVDVKCGRWIIEKRKNIWGYMVDARVCSNCGKVYSIRHNHNYCPDCGSNNMAKDGIN